MILKNYIEEIFNLYDNCFDNIILVFHFCFIDEIKLISIGF